MAKFYRSGLTKVYNKEVDLNSDTMVWTLHTSSYTPNQDTHVYVSDLTNELAAGGGYTQGTASGGGLAGTVTQPTYTAANSWSVSRANSTSYNVGDVVRPASANGFLYRCVVAGTSAGAPPTFSTTLGRETADNTVVWETVGSGIVVVSATSPVWSAATFGPCRYAVLSDRSSGANATDPLICYVDFVTDKTGGGGNFTVNLNSTLGVSHYFIP